MSKDPAANSAPVRGRPFPPGVSGNPSGRPKVIAELQQAAEEGSPAAVRRLVELIDSDDERIALAAVNSILDRVMGKPRQAVEVSAAVGTNQVIAALLLRRQTEEQGP